MTVSGWIAGIAVVGFISSYGHWIVFILLLVVGVKMIGEGIHSEWE